MRVRSAPKRNRHTENESSGSPAEGTGSWRLPSGLDLAEFALQGGFLMPALMAAHDTREENPPVPVRQETTAVGGQG